jgi:hypothetical protein
MCRELGEAASSEKDDGSTIEKEKDLKQKTNQNSESPRRYWIG